MQIHKLDNNSTMAFQAKLSEKKIIEGVTRILEDRRDVPIVKTDFAYFQDMLKGSYINPFRKAEIDEWIRDRETQYANFNEKEEVRKTKEYLEYQERKGRNKIEQLLHKAKKIIRGDKILSHPLMKQVIENASNARLFKMFTDLFNSYLELTPKGENKVASEEEIIRDNFRFNLGQTIESKAENVQAVKAEPVERTTKKLSNNNPRQLLNITEDEAMKLRDEYFELKQWCDTNIDWQNFTPGEGNHKVFLEKFRPLEKKVQEHNISIIRKKEFSSNPLEQVQEKHEYIHYEVLPKARFNEASFYDALKMFEKYGTREEYQKMGISTLTALNNSLPEHPTEASVTKLIKLYGKHVDDFVYPDERDGAPNSIVYEQDFLQVAEKAKTVEQARLVLENGRRMFWSDSNIDDVADAWMVDKGAPFKGNEEVKKILDEMFKCAAKNREPFMNDHWLQKKVEMWNRSSRRYKN